MTEETHAQLVSRYYSLGMPYTLAVTRADKTMKERAQAKKNTRLRANIGGRSGQRIPRDRPTLKGDVG
jgi:hypothetical protein